MTLVVAAIGFGDFMWQRHRHMKELKMTREEVKREHKEQEGDPQHKHERMRLHRELLQQRMINAVKKADFVVVNPDHIAVAIKYDRDSQEAPTVVAKGERILAEKIKEVAREAGVPIFRNVSLARALRDVEEGDEIPEALYEAVAEILRVVYGPPGGDRPVASRRRRSRPSRPPSPAGNGPSRARAQRGNPATTTTDRRRPLRLPAPPASRPGAWRQQHPHALAGAQQAGAHRGRGDAQGLADLR